MNSNLLSLFGRMSPDFYLPTEATTSLPSSLNFGGSGILEDGELLMLNTSEWPSAAEGSSVCSLAEILEPTVARKYYLSPKACAGILRRAEKRGKDLPEPLMRALKAVADSGRTSSLGGASPVTGSLKSSDGRRNGMPSDSPEDRLLVTHTLRAEGFDASEDGTGRGVPLVADCLQERDSKGSDSKGSDSKGSDSETKNGHLVPMAVSCKDSGGDCGEVSPTLRSMEFDGSHANGGGQIAVAFQASDFKTGQFEQHEQARPLTTSADRSRAAPITASVMGVRRLTPTECERLQGFADGWTAGFADGPRYRMLGNAVARPCAEWIGRRLVETARRTAQG